MNNLLCKQCDNFTSGLINGLCKTCFNKPENTYRDIECLNCNTVFIINFDTLFCASCRNKSEVIENIRTEYIRLKAIEQAAKDFVKNEGSFYADSAWQDLQNLKELLRID